MNMIDTTRVRNGDTPDHNWSITAIVKSDTQNIDPIPPGKGKKVTINVTIPKDYAKGMGAFSYTIEPNPASKLLARNGLQTKTQFFGRSFINIATETMNNRLLEIAKTELSQNGVLSLELLNKGDKVLEVKGEVIILDSKNKQLGKFDLTNQYNFISQLAVPLKDVSYKMNSVIPKQLISQENKLLITFKDLKREFSQTFLKNIKINQEVKKHK